jgi:hypothetical protein
MKMEIDFITDEGLTPGETLDRMIKGYDGLVVSVTAEHGPTGWPTALVTGPTDSVVKFAEAYGYEV